MHVVHISGRPDACSIKVSTRTKRVINKRVAAISTEYQFSFPETILKIYHLRLSRLEIRTPRIFGTDTVNLQGAREYCLPGIHHHFPRPIIIHITCSSKTRFDRMLGIVRICGRPSCCSGLKISPAISKYFADIRSFIQHLNHLLAIPNPDMPHWTQWLTIEIAPNDVTRITWRRDTLIGIWKIYRESPNRRSYSFPSHDIQCDVVYFPIHPFRLGIYTHPKTMSIVRTATGMADVAFNWITGDNIIQQLSIITPSLHHALISRKIRIASPAGVNPGQG